MSYQEYVDKFIPSPQRWKLSEQLDFDDDAERDLLEIAKGITEWEEKLVGPLEITKEEGDDIKEEAKPELRRLAS